MMYTRKNNSGFTLIELITVIGIVAVLSSIVLVMLGSARESARISAGIQFEANILHGIGDQMVGEWKFNDNSNPTTDTSSFNYIGNVFGAMWISNGGFDGKGAYNFNGSNNYIQTTMPLSLLKKDSWAISAWVTGNDPTSFYNWIVGESSGSGQFLIGKQAGVNAMHINIMPGCGVYYNIPNTAIFDGKYHHVAVVDTKGVLQVYIDGNLKSSLGSNCVPTDNSNMRIGAGSNGEYWNGKIDNVRVYTTSLTAVEVEQIYAEGLKTHQDLAVK